MKTDERQIALGGTTDEQAHRAVQKDAGGVFPGYKIKDAVPDFKKVTDYTTFDVEYTLIGDDLVVHFFLTEEMQRLNAGPQAHQVEKYWLQVFPAVLDSVAQSHFDATKPRLEAKYTEELASWFFRAKGYSYIIDLDAFVRIFFEELDQGLESL